MVIRLQSQCECRLTCFRINLPEVVVATFYSGMPPEDIETDITDPLERFFTLASGIDHMESRSLLRGVSIIKVFSNPARTQMRTSQSSPTWLLQT
ncbi:MAG: efflux RND transporter permease subunit [Terriglobia bacterium]